MLIRMSVGMSGGRHDDQAWPPLHGTIEVPDWEGIELVRGGMAVPEGDAARGLWREYRASGIWQAHEYLAGRQAAPEPEREPLLPPPPERDPVPEVVSVAPPQVSPVAEVSPVAGTSETEMTRDPEDEHDRLEAVADGTEPPDPGPEPEQVTEAEPAERPAPSAPKQAWIDYAVTQGADVHEASAMTKVDLMSRYGGRL